MQILKFVTFEKLLKIGYCTEKSKTGTICVNRVFHRESMMSFRYLTLLLNIYQVSNFTGP